MLHLLTETQKNKVIREYRIRLAVTICIFIILICLTGLILLVPSYLSAVGRVNIIKNENQQKKNLIASLKKQDYDSKIKKVDNNLVALKKTVNVMLPREAYNKIVSNLPPNVYLSRYSYNLVDENSASISIDGTAADRDTLVLVFNNLRSIPEFTGITIPVSSFTKKTDLGFSFNFNLNTPTKK